MPGTSYTASAPPKADDSIACVIKLDRSTSSPICTIQNSPETYTTFDNFLMTFSAYSNRGYIKFNVGNDTDLAITVTVANLTCTLPATGGWYEFDLLVPAAGQANDAYNTFSMSATLPDGTSHDPTLYIKRTGRG